MEDKGDWIRGCVSILVSMMHRQRVAREIRFDDVYQYQTFMFFIDPLWMTSKKDAEKAKFKGDWIRIRVSISEVFVYIDLL